MPRFGVRLENQGRLTPKEFQGLASLAEGNGYEVVWVPEGRGFDSISQLTAMATSTQRVRLATGILPVFSRTPMAIAMAAAGLTAVSSGRFVLGLGVGHRPSVEGGDGVPFSRPMARLRETIQIVRSLLAGERVSHQGRVFNLSNASLGPAAPLAKVPLYIAALGPQMLELAGELADGVLLNWTASKHLAESIRLIAKGAARASRDPSVVDIAGYVRVAVVDNVVVAKRALQGQIAGYAANTFYRTFFEQTGFADEMAAARSSMERGDAEAAAQAITEEMQEQVAVVGDEDHCRAEVEKRRSLGLSLPVIAPFQVEDAGWSYERTVRAFAS